MIQITNSSFQSIEQTNRLASPYSLIEQEVNKIKLRNGILEQQSPGKS